MKKKTILITDYILTDLSEGLADNGFEVVYDPVISQEEINHKLPGIHGIIVNTRTKMDRKRIEMAPILEFIGRLGSGLDIIDLDVAQENQVEVISTPEANANAVAEHVIGMILSLARNLNIADRQVREDVWKREENRGFALKGKTLGIIGFGNNGSALGRKVESMDLQVLAYDKYKFNYADDLMHVRETSQEDVLQNSDIISMHVPLTGETEYMVNKNFLNSCRDGVLFINTSRGKVVRTLDLIQALQSGKVKAAGLDVFENEKPETYNSIEQKMYDELHGMKQTILTPHIAGWTYESKKAISKILLKKILNYYADKA